MNTSPQFDSSETSLFVVPRTVIKNRDAHIVEECRDLNVLHLGCCDHPFTKSAIESGRWLHGRIADTAKTLTGLDLSEEGVEACNRINGAANIILGDACAVSELPQSPFDLVVAGEIIEHVPNPGNMLVNMRRFLGPDGRLIITTPNAFALRKQLRVLVGKESVHPDHVCYFSHRTLAKLLHMSGYEVISQANVALHNYGPLYSRVLERVASLISPAILEGIYVEARPM